MGERLKENRTGIIFLLLSLAWMTVIFMFSAQTGEESGSQSGFITDIICGLFNIEATQKNIDIITFIVRKTAHFTEYAILGALYFKTLTCFLRKHGSACRITASSALCMIYAISDEFHQSFSDGRTPALRDVVIDTLGGICGSALVLCVILIIRKRRRMVKAL